MTAWLLPLLRDRLIRLVWLLPLAAAGLFALVSLAPFDPVEAYVGARTALIGPEQRSAIAAAWGLDRPAPERFLLWLSNALRGDLGDSLTYNAPVVQVISDRFAASLQLIALAFGVSFVLGTGLGLFAAATQGRWPDRIIRFMAVFLAASPSFWIALLLIAVFAVGLGWLPSCCALPPGVTLAEGDMGQHFLHMILPALTLCVIGIAPLVLHTRTRMLAFLDSPAAQHLAVHGAGSRWLVLGPGLRHALGPALTLHLAGAGELFGGSVLAETVFAWPGLGQATVKAATGADAPLLMGIGLATLVFVFFGNLLADVVARLLDPRLRSARRVT
jgi:peptide/nickel transport system permease protein